MKKVVSILLAMTIVCSLFTGCVTNNNSTSDTSPAGNSTTTNDTKTYRMALIQPQNNLDYFNFITASAQKYADANGIELTVWQQNSDQAKGGEFVDMAVEQGYDAVMICELHAQRWKKPKGRLLSLVMMQWHTLTSAMLQFLQIMSPWVVCWANMP